MVLPDGFALPPLPYILVLVGLAIATAVLLLVRDPPVTERTVVALAPWMAVGGALHVLFVLNRYPASIEPLFGTPSVYLTTFVLAGVVWLVSTMIARPGGPNRVDRRIDRRLGLVGLGLLLVAGASVVISGYERGVLSFLWPLVGVVGSIILTAFVWLIVDRLFPAVAETTGRVGVLVVFSHVLDGVTTAIGVDVLATGERSPLPRLIMDVAATLPMADVVGVGWLFVLVKVALAAAIVGLFVDYVRERPTHAYLLLALVAAVGLGPGIHNLLLFAVLG